MKKRFIRRKRFGRRKRTFKRRYFKKKQYKSSKYDGSYLAKCTIAQDLNTPAGGGGVFFGMDWGGTTLFGGYQSIGNCPEFQTLRTVYREYRIVGIKMKINFIKNPVFDG